MRLEQAIRLMYQTPHTRVFLPNWEPGMRLELVDEHRPHLVIWMMRTDGTMSPWAPDPLDLISEDWQTQPPP